MVLAIPASLTDRIPTGASLQINKLRDSIRRTSSIGTDVLITGETGVGKGVIARAVHERSERPGRLLTINCAALPANLVESELFGHERGAFTDARECKPGLLELAGDGSLLLDEITELPLSLQSKLLTVLDERRLRRLGGREYHELNLRLMATTNINLERAVAEGRFRRDLYYRLNVIQLHVPPLRERLEDIPPLCTSLLDELCDDELPAISEHQMVLLQDHTWPGNIRELRNVLQRGLVLRLGDEYRPADFIKHKPAYVETTRSLFEDGVLTMAQMQGRYARRILNYCNGNKSKAAKLLGISRNTLQRKLKL
jgi:transcriptional regulator with PAS, ATPase and Fis domain